MHNRLDVMLLHEINQQSFITNVPLHKLRANTNHFFNTIKDRYFTVV
ncbi:Uncharacterised protein [Vibrio cholerae]|uniref:Uncharacterized protein n=2 Tax=Vibrio cholerae TaxID=666 RepID=A0A655WBM3_VIBCL|nr:Uncharacterised protein [Vibrio cholerae]CSA51888.1 Uncharacterised protein [Vibrio cholerae]CSA97264.1 Uncharacterised protein [Vibrio cholerae]CSB09703.1 Uncharacterised protein [Vibrio cholerae]CSB30239.1 Uncharacterised protein [Vibrio cholerae]